jgi:hypothetical protein
MQGPLWSLGLGTNTAQVESNAPTSGQAMAAKRTTIQALPRGWSWNASATVASFSQMSQQPNTAGMIGCPLCYQWYNAEFAHLCQQARSGATYGPQPLTAEEVRKIVREELERALSKSNTANEGET